MRRITRCGKICADSRSGGLRPFQSPIQLTAWHWQVPRSSTQSYVIIHDKHGKREDVLRSTSLQGGEEKGEGSAWLAGLKTGEVNIDINKRKLKITLN